MLTMSLAAALLCACGGLENEPLTLGIVRGALVSPGAKASVSIFSKPEFLSTVDSEGRFELRDVPHGSIEVLALISDTHAERIKVDVVGGHVVDLGQRVGRPANELEIEPMAPGFQSIARGRVWVEGTPLQLVFGETTERSFRLPEGCYQVQAEVPGLGSKVQQVCVTEATRHEVHLEFDVPDGSPGHEGCAVSGCEDGLECHADGACGF